MTNDLAPARHRGSYGIDAPYLLAVPAALVLSTWWQVIITKSAWPLVGAGLILVCVGLSVHATKRGKFVVWGELLRSLRGDERLLDIGCGRGAVLMTAAHRLPRGRAVGVDLWRTQDQSGNSAQATRRNAFLEGVADRVDVETGELTDLPFPAGSFDVVVSMGALHNVGRDRVDLAIDEAVRMLRPGGRLLIADIRFTRRYERRLRHLGFRDVARRELGWRLWWSGPWLRSTLVTATRPA
ncbi:SAM-dependent methyltransferase [Actinoplanes sp. CA-051413]|uniref:SAM-dependent methyltransferase n=1 Tax=Actinoplanes sp. CA-051413 TaxID=3239899 RepID=UPI003D99A3CF